MTAVRRAPVARHRVLGAAVLVLVAMFGLAAMTELLRHPLPGAPAVLPEELDAPGGDPRDEVVCEDPLPREGQPRAEGDAEPLQEVTSNQLYDCPQTWADTTVHYRGEAVGAVLWRGDRAWVHLNDDAYAGVLGPLPTHRDFRGGNAGVGVLLPRSLAQEIDSVGGPGRRGDVLEITAIFRRVHEDSGEVAILEALDGRVVQRGGPHDNPLLVDRLVVALVLAPVALALVVWSRLRARRR